MQQPVPAAISLVSYWPQILVFCAANWVITGVVVRAIADSQFMAAFDRCKDRITNRIDAWYKDRRDAIDATMAAVDIHDDRLTAFEQSLLQQGAALSQKLSEHFTSNTRAMENVTAALGAIQHEAAETAKAVARIEGRMEGGEWNGKNRRKRTRRSIPEGGQ